MTKVLKYIAIFLIVFVLMSYIAGNGANEFVGIHVLIVGLGIYLFIRSPQIDFKPPSLPKKRELLKNTAAFLFFSGVVFVFQFWRVRDFGLYESDLFKVLPAFTWQWQDLYQFVRNTLFSPLTTDSVGDVLIAVFSFIGYQMGGLQGIYLFSMLIPAAISLLFFLIIKKILGDESELPALFGALLFIFFPTYRIPQLLYLTFSKQAALLLMLCSLYAFLHQRKLMSELLMFATMIIVKDYAPIFLMFPLFRTDWTQNNFWQNWLDHLKTTALPLLWIIMSISIQSGMRNLFSRVLEYILIPLRFFEGFSKSAFGNGFVNFGTSPLTLFLNTSLQFLLVFLSAWLIFSLLFILRKPRINIAAQSFIIKTALFTGEIEILSDPNLLRSLRISLVSFVVLVFSFAGFEHTTPANVYMASWSYTYLVNVLPMILMLTGTFSVLLFFPKKIYQRIAVILIATAFLSLLGLNRFHSQGYLAQIWQVDQWLWTNVLTETETLSDDTELIIQYSPDQVVLPTRYQNIDIFHGHDLLSGLFEPDPGWYAFPKALINTGTYSADPQDGQAAAGRVVRFSILDGQLYLVEPAEEAPQTLPNQIPIAVLNKKPLYDMVFVNEFIGKSVSDVFQQEGSDVK